jgi:polysaccharide biosynthesis protein PslH
MDDRLFIAPGSKPMKIYYVASRFPFPLIKGDKLRAFHQIKELSKTCDIYLAALSDETVDDIALKALEPYCREIRVFRIPWVPLLFNLFWYFVFSRKPLQVGYFFNKGIAARMQKEIQRIRPDHIFCQLIRTAAYAQAINGIPKTLDYMDALSAGMERRAEQTGYFLKPFFRMEARRLKRYERGILKHFDHACVISESDRNLIFNHSHKEIAVVPNGIDSEFFHPVKSEKEFDLLFTGNMSYPPNVKSAEFLVDRILPLVWRTRPETTLLISGANPVASIRRLQSDVVRVQGWTDDIRSSFAKCRIFVAPMLIGSGLQNKLLEAMAMGLPCITSELANRSLGAKEEEQILIGRSEEDYAKLLLRLLENREAANDLAKKGNIFVLEHFIWPNSNRILLDLMTYENYQTRPQQARN